MHMSYGWLRWGDRELICLQTIQLPELPDMIDWGESSVNLPANDPSPSATAGHCPSTALSLSLSLYLSLSLSYMIDWGE